MKTKFEIMRRNRRTMRVAALREEARELGYDSVAETRELLEAAAARFDSCVMPPSVVFGRKPERNGILPPNRLMNFMGWFRS